MGDCDLAPSRRSSPTTASSCSTWPGRPTCSGPPPCSAPTPATNWWWSFFLDGASVRSSDSGVLVVPDASLVDLAWHPLPARHRARSSAGLSRARRTAQADGFVPALRAVAARSERVASVCTGAFGLAVAGLLDGYAATTHWASCARLAEHFPAVDVQPDRIFVHDRDRWTSAGVTAGIDLALAMVEHDHDAELAHSVAGWLVVFVNRTGGQSQFSAAPLRRGRPQTSAIRDLQHWLPDHLGRRTTSP